MNIRLRSMQVNDAAQVQILSRQLGYTASVSETAERISKLLDREQDYIVAAWSEDRIVGWMHVFKTTRLEAGSYTEIAALVIDEQYRGLKIGAQLVAAAKAWSFAQGINKLVVRSNALREQAHRFYIACGFTTVKEHKVFQLLL